MDFEKLVREITELLAARGYNRVTDAPEDACWDNRLNRVCLFYVPKEMPQFPYAIRRQKYDGPNVIPVQPPMLRGPNTSAETLTDDIERALMNPY